MSLSLSLSPLFGLSARMVHWRLKCSILAMVLGSPLQSVHTERRQQGDDVHDLWRIAIAEFHANGNTASWLDFPSFWRQPELRSSRDGRGSIADTHRGVREISSVEPVRGSSWLRVYIPWVYDCVLCYFCWMFETHLRCLCVCVLLPWSSLFSVHPCAWACAADET